MVRRLLARVILHRRVLDQAGVVIEEVAVLLLMHYFEGVDLPEAGLVGGCRVVRTENRPSCWRQMKKRNTWFLKL